MLNNERVGRGTDFSGSGGGGGGKRVDLSLIEIKYRGKKFHVDKIVKSIIAYPMIGITWLRISLQASDSPHSIIRVRFPRRVWKRGRGREGKKGRGGEKRERTSHSILKDSFQIVMQVELRRLERIRGKEEERLDSSLNKPGSR